MRSNLARLMAMAALWVVAAFACATGTANASCGDYLKHPSFGHVVSQPESVAGLLPGGDSPIPCNGPHCGRQKQVPSDPLAPFAPTVSVHDSAVAGLVVELTGPVSSSLARVTGARQCEGAERELLKPPIVAGTALVVA